MALECLQCRSAIVPISSSSVVHPPIKKGLLSAVCVNVCTELYCFVMPQVRSGVHVHVHCILVCIDLVQFFPCIVSSSESF